MNANKGVFGVNLGHMWDEIDRMTGWVDQLMSLWEEGAIKPKVARIFRFDEAAAAHHFIQDRKNMGKVLLRRSPPSLAPPLGLQHLRRGARRTVKACLSG